MGGIDEINYKCQREADLASMDGIFRAFLSSHQTNLVHILNDEDTTMPIVNSRSKSLFPSWDYVFDTPLHRDVVLPDTDGSIYSFDGKNTLLDTYWYAIN